jgi:transposase
LRREDFSAHRSSIKGSEDETENRAADICGRSKTIKDIRRATRKHHSAEDKIRIVLEGLRGEDSIAAICRREGIAESLYYSWSKEFLEAGKKRLPETRPVRPPATR